MSTVNVPESYNATRQVEAALISALLMEGASKTEGVIDAVKGIVTPSDFLDSGFPDNQHTRIYEAMLKCRYPDQITVARQMNTEGTLQKGDITYMSQIISEAPGIDYKDYAEAIVDYATKRRNGESAEATLQALTPFSFGLTDLGNAERLIRQYGDRLHYCYERKQWLIWNGKVWEWDLGPKIIELAKLTARNIYHEAGNEPDDKERKNISDHAKRSENDHRINAMINLAQSERGIPVKIADLDSNPWLLNVKNGTIDLQNGELRAHTPTDLITNIIDLDYTPDAESPAWQTFLERIFNKDRQLIVFVQRAAGYSVTASQEEQIFLFCHGGGFNGKTTLLGTIQDVLGPYASEIDPTAFMVDKNSRPGPNESIASLYKTRFVASTEIQEGQKLSVSLVKRMTGGEMLRCERKFEHGFNFKPTHKLWLSGNHEPHITDTTNSIWLRIKYIPFIVQIPEGERVKNLRHVLCKEHGQTILAWLVQGCVKWRTHGLEEPPTVTNATQQYRDKEDILHDFLLECCLIAAGEGILVSDLYKDYKTWTDETDSYCLGKNNFNERLREKGLKSRVGSGNKKEWRGIRLLTDDEKVSLVTLGDTFPQSPLVKGFTEKEEGKQGQKVTNITASTPESDISDKNNPVYPASPCPNCGGDYWLRKAGPWGPAQWLCVKCHPQPKRKKAPEANDESGE